MKRTVCLLVFTVLCTIGAHAQIYYDFYSTMWVDSASGEVYGQGITDVGINDGGCNCATVSASVSSSMSPNGAVDYESDNGGAGSAITRLYGQVDYLGETWTINSIHAGLATLPDGIYWDAYGDLSSASFTVPNAPYLYLTGINASDPYNVAWRYAIGGTCPYSLNWQLGEYIDIVYGCPYSQFTTNQQWYPSGYNTAEMTMHMYGVTVFGTTCTVNRVDNASINHTTGTYEWDGKGEEITGEFINVDHIVAVVETYFQYSGSGCNVDYGGRLTAVQSATGSISTETAFAGTNSEIIMINENFNYPGAVETLGPETHYTIPAQSEHFQSRENDYPPYWWGAGAPVSICNTFLEFGTEFYFYANPVGCIGLQLI